MITNSAPLCAFIYARKSTDKEDRQVYSIDHQLKELREYAAKNNIPVVDELEERCTAKVPGRPVFNTMMARIKKGEANCILAWDPDRIARNAVDGGMIIHYVDTSLLKNLKFVTCWFEPTPQGLLTLAIAFGIAKYHVDAMSQGINRAYRRRVEEGYWPRPAPIGYVFDRNTRTVVFDPIRAPLIRQTFQFYATGDYTLDELTHAINDRGLRGRKTKKYPGKPLTRSRYYDLLQNPFYCGMLRLRGELFEGKHKPIVPLTLFDRCQIVLAQRGRKSSSILKPFLYRKMFRCGECGCVVTNETKKGHNYLRCTKRSGSCSQRYMREEVATACIAKIVRKLVVPENEIDRMVALVQEQQSKESDSVAAEVKEMHTEIIKLDDKQRRLIDVYVEGTLQADLFQKRKEKLLRQRRELTEKLTFLENHPKQRFEPAIRFIRGLTKPQTVMTANDPRQLRDFLKKVGSNLSIKDGRVMSEFRGPWKTVAAQGFLAARRRAASESVASQFVSHAKFSTLCRPSNANRTDELVRLGAGRENRTMHFVDAIGQFFKDNPTWE